MSSMPTPPAGIPEPGDDERPPEDSAEADRLASYGEEGKKRLESPGGVEPAPDDEA